MIHRIAEDALMRLASQFPAVGVTGPRQSGKTTMVKAIFPDKKYVTFDERPMRELASSNPRDFLMAFTGPFNGLLVCVGCGLVTKPQLFRNALRSAPLFRTRDRNRVKRGSWRSARCSARAACDPSGSRCRRTCGPARGCLPRWSAPCPGYGP